MDVQLQNLHSLDDIIRFSCAVCNSNLSSLLLHHHVICRCLIYRHPRWQGSPDSGVDQEAMHQHVAASWVSTDSQVDAAAIHQPMMKVLQGSIVLDFHGKFIEQMEAQCNGCKVDMAHSFLTLFDPSADITGLNIGTELSANGSFNEAISVMVRDCMCIPCNKAQIGTT